MINKSINIQSLITFEEQNAGFLNCQIGCDMSSINLSVQVIDKELCKKYEEELQKMCGEFIKTSLEEAVKVGWNMLKVEF